MDKNSNEPDSSFPARHVGRVSLNVTANIHATSATGVQKKMAAITCLRQ
jgi:hypothetical protein